MCRDVLIVNLRNVMAGDSLSLLDFHGTRVWTKTSLNTCVLMVGGIRRFHTLIPPEVFLFSIGKISVLVASQSHRDVDPGME